MARQRLDADRLAAAYERDGRRLLIFFTRRTYDAQLAVDLVAETYARAVRGADHSMLSISGIVPNGVPAVFLTAPDGTAVRATSRTTATSSCCPTNARTSSATSCGPGRRDAPRPAASSPSPPCGPARASPPPSWRSPWRACRRTARRVHRGADRRQVRRSRAPPTIAGAASAPPGRGRWSYVMRCAGGGPSRRASLSPAARSRASGRRAAGASGAAGRRGPGPARPGARHPRARASPQAPLTARRPRVASMRWLLPDPSSS